MGPLNGSCGPQNRVARWRWSNSEIYSQNRKNGKFGMFYQQCCPSMAPGDRDADIQLRNTSQIHTSDLPFAYVMILSIFPFSTGKIWEDKSIDQNFQNIVLDSHANFREKLSSRPWLHCLKKQSQFGSSSKFSKMMAACGCWVGNTPENLSISDRGNMFNIS